MKKTSTAATPLFVPLILTFLVISCKRNCEFCADCQNSFASEAKIKRISVHHEKNLATLIEFSYDRNLIDSIHQTVYSEVPPVRTNYKLFYDHCVLTGFQSHETSPDPLRVNYTVDGGFVVDSDKVTKEIQVRYNDLPFGNNVLNAKLEYTVSADGTIPRRLKRCLNCAQLGRTNLAHYDAARNVDSYITTTDMPVFTEVNGPWDDKMNPFSRQNGLLYYFDLLPFTYATPPSGEGDRFDFIPLSRNNPKLISNLFNGNTYTFKLDYTYDGMNRPVVIKISERDEIGGPHPGNPFTPVGQLDLEYY